MEGRGSTPIRAAVYVRISKDSTGRAAGVRRQEKDCRALAAERGWEVAEAFKDNDTSAYRKKPRPEWRKLLAAVERKEVQAIVAWHPDRMYRRAADLEELVDFVDTHRLKIATVSGGDVDLSTASGRMTARVVGAVAQAESERMSERIRRGLQERREAGKPAVGGLRPYGYDKGYDAEFGAVTLIPNKEESDIIRLAEGKLLAGASWGSVAKELNRLGAPTVKGGSWSPYLLRETLLKPSLYGLQPDGTPGAWEAVLEPRVRRLLERRVGNGDAPDLETGLPDDEQERDREKRRRLAAHAGKAAREGSRRYVLTGIVRCSECGRKMLGAGGLYRCSIIRGGCGRTSVTARSLESEVIARTNPLDEKRWRSQRPRRSGETEKVLDEMERLEAQLDALAENLDLTERQVAVRSAKIRERLGELRDRLPSGDEEPPAPNPERTQELLQAWATGTMDQRQIDLLAGFLARRIEEVTVEPGRGNVEKRTKVRLAGQRKV